MTNYRIICTTQEPVSQPTTHAHIVAVGTGATAQHYTQRWTLAEVLAAMDRGDTFYTRGESSGREARVEKYTCTACWRTWIRSTADAVQDNNLDNLPRCG